MQALEMTLTEKDKLFVIVEYSIMSQINRLLCTIFHCVQDEIFIEYIYDVRKRYYDEITKTSDMYLRENRGLMSELYELFNNRSNWQDAFVVDYNIFWDNESNRFPLLEINSFLDKMDDVARNLESIIRLDYQQMKRDNMPFAEELAKYVFKPSRIMTLSQQYGLESFIDYLDILD